MKFALGSHAATRTSWCLGACALLLAVPVSAQAQPAVVLHLDGTWPEQLAIEVRKDVGASLNERGVEVLTDGDPAARATLMISPPSAGAPWVRVQVVNPDREVAAARELSLLREHPDTWSVAIAATADELLAATWSLPEPQPPAPVVPPLDEQRIQPQPAPPSAASVAPEPRHGDIALGVALEQYLPNAQLYGADVYAALSVTETLDIELGAWFRDIAARDSLAGEVYGTVVGGDVVLRGNVTRGPWLGVDVLTGVHAGVVWFDGRANAGARAGSATGALLSARLGGRASLFTTERTRVSLTATAGLPVVTATARDTGREVLKLKGLELGGRLEVGWQF